MIRMIDTRNRTKKNLLTYRELSVDRAIKFGPPVHIDFYLLGMMGIGQPAAIPGVQPSVVPPASVAKAAAAPPAAAAPAVIEWAIPQQKRVAYSAQFQVIAAFPAA